jgi:hypothetical protein
MNHNIKLPPIFRMSGGNRLRKKQRMSEKRMRKDVILQKGGARDRGLFEKAISDFVQNYNRKYYNTVF